MTLMLAALIFDSMVNFDAIVANVKFFIQVPKHNLAAWANNLLLLLTSANLARLRNLNLLNYGLLCFNWVGVFVGACFRMEICSYNILVGWFVSNNLWSWHLLVKSGCLHNYLVNQIIRNKIIIMLLELWMRHMLRLFRCFWIPLLVFCFRGDSCGEGWNLAGANVLSKLSVLSLAGLLLESFEVRNVVGLSLSLALSGLGLNDSLNWVHLSFSEFRLKVAGWVELRFLKL